MRTLAEILTRHEICGYDRDECTCDTWTQRESGKTWAEHVAAAHREARTITTREQLDALPARTVIQELDSSTETLLKKADYADWWMDLADDPGVQAGFVADYHLPALVLWLPEDDA